MARRSWKPIRRAAGSSRWKEPSSVCALHIRRSSGRLQAVMPARIKRGCRKKVWKNSKLPCVRLKKSPHFWRICFHWICRGRRRLRSAGEILMSVSEHCTDRCLVLTCSRMSEPPVRAVRTGAPGVPKKRVKHGKFLTKTYETVITIHKGKTMWT